MHLSSVAALLLWLASPVVVETAVTGCRGDRDTDHRPRQNCTAAGFRQPPPGFEPSTQVLLFPLNQFSDLSWSSFSVFKDIYEIDLSQNQISRLTPSDVPVLPSLAVLRLGSNRLRAVPDHCFSASPALTNLYLQGNLLSSLTDHSFSGLSKLKILDLSDNHIETLPVRMMHPLAAIETLFLEANKIKVMPDGWFSQKEMVHYLFLSANPWACSCSLGYLHAYLEEYEANVYVRDGPIISPDGQSVICDSPQSLRGKSVVSLTESDFCNDQGTPTTTIPAFTTNIPTTTAISTTTTTTTDATTEYVTQKYYKVVTSYEIFTSFAERFDHWESNRGDGRVVKKTTAPPKTEAPTTTLATFPSTRRQTSTKPPTTTTVEATEAAPIAIPAKTTPTDATSDASITVASATRQTSTKSATFSTSDATETRPTTISTFERVKTTPRDAIFPISTISNARVQAKMVSAARSVFCFWLFAGCVFLCVISAVSSLITVVRLYFWYHGVYKSLKCVIVGKQQLKMVTYSSCFAPPQARYRTMLFVAKDAKDAECFVDLGPKDRILEAKNAGNAVYKQTMYRVVGKEEEIEAKVVLAECGASREASDAARRKRYSVILREVSENDGGEAEKHDWVVGGWEAEKGAGHGDSWGAWLGEYLPRMPWWVSAPAKSEAESEESGLNKTEKEG